VLPAIDADADGMPDAWELASFGTLTNTAAGDRDGDGSGNLDEYIADTQPTNAASFFAIDGIVRGGTTALVEVAASAPGRFHGLRYRESLTVATNWTAVGESLAGDGGLLRLPDSGPATTRLYRVDVHLP
jgi:hypothetical protein